MRSRSSSFSRLSTNVSNSCDSCRVIRPLTASRSCAAGRANRETNNGPIKERSEDEELKTHFVFQQIFVRQNTMQGSWHTRRNFVLNFLILRQVHVFASKNVCAVWYLIIVVDQHLDAAHRFGQFLLHILRGGGGGGCSCDIWGRKIIRYEGENKILNHRSCFPKQ